METLCIKCNSLKDMHEFSISGFKIKVCKLCKKLNNKIYREKNKLEISKKKKQYREDNKEIIKLKKQEYYKNNCEKIKAQVNNYRLQNIDEIKLKKKIYNENNKEKIKEHRTIYYQNNIETIRSKNFIYYKNNKNKIIEYQKNNWSKISKDHNNYINHRYNNDINFKLNHNLSRRIYHILKKNHSSKNNQLIFNYLNYTIKDLKNHLESQFQTWMWWDNWGMYSPVTWDDYNPLSWTWNIDHIIPISSLPFKNMKEDNFIKCWSLENLRPFSSKQNIFDKNNR